MRGQTAGATVHVARLSYSSLAMGRACQQSFRTGAADRKAIEKKRVSRFHRPGTPSSMRKCIYSPHTFPRVA